MSFYADGTSVSSEGEGTFEVTEAGRLITDYQDAGGGVYTFNYSFSNDGNTLTLTDVHMGDVFVYERQTDQPGGQTQNEETTENESSTHDDFDKFIGSWSQEGSPAIIFTKMVPIPMILLGLTLGDLR